LAVVGLFLLAILALGFSARVRENSVLQFLVAGRRLTLPVFVATLVSTWYGGILGIGEAVGFFGFGTWIMLGVPYYVFALVYALVYAKRVRAADQISIPERLELRYGRSVALFGGLLVFLLALPATHVLMLGVLLQAVTAWDLAPAVIVGTFVGTLFLYRGGLLADARLSLLAFVMMYVGFAVMLGYCLIHFPFGETIGRLEPTLRTFTGGQSLPYILSFFILGAWTLVDPAFHQRVASAASPRTGQIGLFVSTGFWLLFDMLSIGTGMYALALLQESPASPLMIFPAFGDQVLPSGLKAVFLCGMLGTVISAMVGYALISGATLGREIVARMKGAASDEQVTRWTRVGIAAACLLAVILALRLQSVVDLWFAWGGAVVGALLIPVTLSYGIGTRSRCPAPFILSAMMLAFGVAIIWMATAFRAGNNYLEVTIGESTISLGTLLPGLFVSGVIIGIGELIGRSRATR
jgi:solute:Na+ symporter, SSS family